MIFRSCSEVTAVHGNGRPLGATKSDVLLRCLNSLVASLHDAMDQKVATDVRLVVIDDHSSQACVEAMNNLLKQASFTTVFHALECRGNGPSIGECFRWARANVDELFYLVEDDYLHQRTAVAEMLEAYSRASFLVRDRDPVIFPCDYPDRYRAPYPSRIFLGSRRYWRTVMHTTGTFMTSKRNLERYWEQYLALSNYGVVPGVTEENTINQIYREVPCLSPMPSLTKHMHEGLDCPYINWTSWWNESAVEALK